MTEAIIPPYLINPNKTAGDNILKFVMCQGERFGLNLKKSATVEIDGMLLDFDQSLLFLATKDMKIKIIQK